MGEILSRREVSFLKILATGLVNALGRPIFALIYNEVIMNGWQLSLVPILVH